MTLELDGAQLLDKFVDPPTPMPGTRRVTFTGRVTDAPDDTMSYMYAETRDGSVVHPRDGVQRWTAGERRIYAHLHKMQEWLHANVAAYLRTADNWQPEVFPRRLLYAHGMRGSGRLMLLADFCCQHGVNLLVVRRSTHTKDMFFDVYKKAVAMAPCVVYINSATTVFNNPAYTTEFIEAHSRHITSLALNVWTVLTGSFAPKQLLCGRHGAHPIYSLLLETGGDIVNVPCIAALEDATSMAIEFIRDIACNADIVPRDYRSTAWAGVVDHLARAFLFYTPQEARRFVRDVFARHNESCAMQRLPMCEPSAAVFSARLQQLPRVESGGQNHYKMNSRNSYEDYLRHLETWASYAELVGEKPALQYSYTPSVERQQLRDSDLVCISSPTRSDAPKEKPLPQLQYVAAQTPLPPLPQCEAEPETSLLPQCAPTRRTTKRQREAPRPRDELSLKPLPTPAAKKQASAAAKDKSRGFFDLF